MKDDINSNMSDNKSNNGRNSKRKIVYTLLMVFFILLFLGSAAWLIRYFVQISNAQKQNEELQNVVTEQATPAPETGAEGSDKQMQEATPEHTNTPAQEPTPEPTPNPLAAYDVPEKEIDFAAMQQETNEHIYAWITVPGTVIDYPVLQHPEVVGYYLDHNLDHSTG